MSLLGINEERKNYGHFKITHDESQREPAVPKTPFFSSKVKRIGIGTLVLAGVAYLASLDYNNDRTQYNGNLAAAQRLLSAEDTVESRNEENEIWSYVARVEREADLHRVSQSELKVIEKLLNENKVQGARRGEPLN